MGQDEGAGEQAGGKNASGKAGEAPSLVVSVLGEAEASSPSNTASSAEESGLAAAILGEVDVPAFMQGGVEGHAGGEDSREGSQRGGTVAQAMIKKGANSAAVEAYLKLKAQQGSIVRMVK